MTICDSSLYPRFMIGTVATYLLDSPQKLDCTVHKLFPFATSAKVEETPLLLLLLHWCTWLYRQIESLEIMLGVLKANKLAQVLSTSSSSVWSIWLYFLIKSFAVCVSRENICSRTDFRVRRTVAVNNHWDLNRKIFTLSILFGAFVVNYLQCYFSI